MIRITKSTKDKVGAGPCADATRAYWIGDGETAIVSPALIFAGPGSSLAVVALGIAATSDELFRNY
jgi:hypothetical protein